MAIKPTDSIIHLEKIKDVVREEWGCFSVTYPVFWQKFIKHVDDIFESRCKTRTPWFDKEKIIKEEVKRFKGTYHRSMTMGEYVKFKKASDMTFFIMRWS